MWRAARKPRRTGKMDGPGRGTIRTKPTLRSWSKPSTRRPSSRPSSTRRPRIKRSQDADAQLFLMALLYRIDPDDIDPALTARVRARGVRASDVSHQLGRADALQAQPHRARLADHCLSKAIKRRRFSTRNEPDSRRLTLAHKEPLVVGWFRSLNSADAGFDPFARTPSSLPLVAPKA